MKPYTLLMPAGNFMDEYDKKVSTLVANRINSHLCWRPFIINSIIGGLVGIGLAHSFGWTLQSDHLVMWIFGIFTGILLGIGLSIQDYMLLSAMAEIKRRLKEKDNAVLEEAVSSRPDW